MRRVFTIIVKVVLPTIAASVLTMHAVRHLVGTPNEVPNVQGADTLGRVPTTYYFPHGEMCDRYDCFCECGDDLTDHTDDSR